MAGLVPAIHVLASSIKEGVDARHKAGHDENSNYFAAIALASAERLSSSDRKVVSVE